MLKNKIIALSLLFVGFIASQNAHSLKFSDIVDYLIPNKYKANNVGKDRHSQANIELANIDLPYRGGTDTIEISTQTEDTFPSDKDKVNVESQSKTKTKAIGTQSPSDETNEIGLTAKDIENLSKTVDTSDSSSNKNDMLVDVTLDDFSDSSDGSPKKLKRKDSFPSVSDAPSRATQKDNELLEKALLAIDENEKLKNRVSELEKTIRESAKSTGNQKLSSGELAELEEKRKTVRDLEVNIKTLTNEISNLRDQSKALSSELKMTEEAFAEKDAKFSELRGYVASLLETIEKLESELQTKNGMVDLEKKELQTKIDNLYAKVDNQEKIKQELNQQIENLKRKLDSKDEDLKLQKLTIDNLNQQLDSAFQKLTLNNN